MRGHQPLVAMRKAGKLPASVWFEVDSGEAWRNWPQYLGINWARFPGKIGSADVLIEPDDSIPRLDLRFVVGMTVHAQGVDARRVHQLHDACVQAGAKRVLSSVMTPDERVNPRLTALIDSAGEWVL